MMEAFNLQNILTYDGVSLSLSPAGVAIVILGLTVIFLGLILFGIYIALLPKIFKLLKNNAVSGAAPILESTKTSAEIAKPESLTEKPKPEVDMNDIMSVIGIVLHLEQERAIELEGGLQLITIKRNGQQPSLWRSSCKMRKFPLRRRNA